MVKILQFIISSNLQTKVYIARLSDSQTLKKLKQVISKAVIHGRKGSNASEVWNAALTAPIVSTCPVEAWPVPYGRLRFVVDLVI